MASIHMRILYIHNYYLQAGGEDAAFQIEVDLLRQKGHEVQTYEEHNSVIATRNPLAVALDTIWSERSRTHLEGILKGFKPDIVHFQNTFPLVSPSAYYVSRSAGAAVVQTLQNYRLLCPVATFYREGHVCTDCSGRIMAYPGVLRACYHNSRSRTAVIASMLTLHHILGTWHHQIDAYIALTQFAREKFIEGGFSPNRLYIKPNMISHDPVPAIGGGSFALFAGRLTKEKGIRTLLSAWKGSAYPLKIIGDGPMKKEVLQMLGNSSEYRSIEYLGELLRPSVFILMKKADVLIFPSEWFEGFPLVIAEALACGLPVITSDIGSQAEIIRNGYSGLHFRSGDPDDLRTKVDWLLNHPDSQEKMGRNARKEYEEKYTPERNYQILLDIYARAIENRGRR